MWRASVATLAIALAALLAAMGEGSGADGLEKAVAASRASSVTDARDAGPLDLRRLEASRLDPQAQILRIAITTWTNWDRRLLARAAPHRLVVLFDADRDGKVDYTGRVIFGEGALALYIEGSGSAFEPLEMRPAGATAVAVIVPGNSPPNPSGRRVRIAAQSLYVRRGTACDPGCIDRMPDSRWLQTPQGRSSTGGAGRAMVRPPNRAALTCGATAGRAPACRPPLAAVSVRTGRPPA